MGNLFLKSCNRKEQDQEGSHSDSSNDWASADDVSDTSVTSTSDDGTNKFAQMVVFDDMADIDIMSDMTDFSDLADMSDFADADDLVRSLDFSDIGDFTALSEQFMEFIRLLNERTDKGENSESESSSETDIFSLTLEYPEQDENWLSGESESTPRYSEEGSSQPPNSTLPLLLHRVASVLNFEKLRKLEECCPEATNQHLRRFKDAGPLSHFTKFTSLDEEDDMIDEGPIPVRLPISILKRDLYVPHPSLEDMRTLLYPMRLIESNPPTPRPHTIIERSKSCFF